jgi:hypothetical protein
MDLSAKKDVDALVETSYATCRTIFGAKLCRVYNGNLSTTDCLLLDKVMKNGFLNQRAFTVLQKDLSDRPCCIIPAPNFDWCLLDYDLTYLLTASFYYGEVTIMNPKSLDIDGHCARILNSNAFKLAYPRLDQATHSFKFMLSGISDYILQIMPNFFSNETYIEDAHIDFHNFLNLKSVEAQVYGESVPLMEKVKENSQTHKFCLESGYRGRLVDMQTYLKYSTGCCRHRNILFAVFLSWIIKKYNNSLKVLLNGDLNMTQHRNYHIELQYLHCFKRDDASTSETTSNGAHVFCVLRVFTGPLKGVYILDANWRARRQDVKEIRYNESDRAECIRDFGMLYTKYIISRTDELEKFYLQKNDIPLTIESYIPQEYANKRSSIIREERKRLTCLSIETHMPYIRRLRDEAAAAREGLRLENRPRLPNTIISPLLATVQYSMYTEAEIVAHNKRMKDLKWNKNKPNTSIKEPQQRQQQQQQQLNSVQSPFVQSLLFTGDAEGFEKPKTTGLQESILKPVGNDRLSDLKSIILSVLDTSDMQNSKHYNRLLSLRKEIEQSTDQRSLRNALKYENTLMLERRSVRYKSMLEKAIAWTDGWM